MEPTPAPPRRPRLVETHNWRAALREFTVIVAGVLAALCAQAWWDWRQERGREHDYLRQLLADTRENERRLSDAIRDDSAANRSIGRVVDALTRPGPLPPSDSMVKWTLESGNSSEFQALAGTYEALLGTGDLRLIRNDTLRALLVAYGGRLGTDRDMLMLMLEMGLGSVDVMPGKLPFTRRIFLDGPTRDTGFDFEPIRDDPEVAALLFRLQAANSNRLSRLVRMRDDTRRLRRALEAEPSLRRR
ncbi:MAG TPA: hypothetical protein VE913_16590 [Longimicrobium sp.]|nr:hypothetical protein [Longimicrobium sp.]